MNINKIKLIGLFSFCSLILGSDNIFITNYNESDTIYFSNEKYTQISNSKNILELYDILSDDYSKYEMKIIKEHIFSNEEFSNFKDYQKKIKVQDWLSSEGNKEGVSELWVDRYYDPMDINAMSYSDILSLPNVSPMDASAVIEQQDKGIIKSDFELKNSPGISNWGYKNIKTFLDLDKKCSIEFDVCLYLIGDKMYYESRKPISEFEIKHNECIEELNGGEIESREFNISNRKGIDSDGSYYNIFKAISFNNNFINPGDGVLFEASGQMNENCMDEYNFIGKRGELLSVNLISHGVSSSDFKKSSFRYTTTIKTTPLTTNPDIDINSLDLLSSFKDGGAPAQLHKAILSQKINSNSYFRTGILFNKYLGQLYDINTVKKYASLEHIPIYKTPFTIDKFVLGNFTVSSGQGVAMETTDFFSPRKTGFGYSKRSDGINTDLTRSSQYVMNGFGLQFSTDFFAFYIFKSYSPRDAIINEDENSFSSLIVMQPRLPYGFNSLSGDTTLFSNMVSSVNELTKGWNFKFGKGGDYIGLSLYESFYDLEVKPDIINTIAGGDDPEYNGAVFFNTYMSNSADPEIVAMYSNSPDFINSDWENAKSYRSVASIYFSKIIKNMVIQGEYAELSDHLACSGDGIAAVLRGCDSEDSAFNFGKGRPKAVVLNSFAQFNDLSYLILYRNYDLDFDNPYQRSFSNYQRYKTTIFEDTYWLQDEVYGYLYSGNPQPQSEEGIFFNTRYRFNSSFVLGMDLDTWERKADDAKYFRTVVRLQWRPLFNYRISLRQKWQARGTLNLQNPSPYDLSETILRLQLRLSNRDQFLISYSRGYNLFSPRPRLTGNSLGGSEMFVGDVGSPDQSIGFNFVHNFDNNLTVKLGSVFIKGFIWYIEDTDFRVFDSALSSLSHNWISARFTPSKNLSVSIKFSLTHQFPSTTTSNAQTESGYWIDNPLINSNSSDYRIQINYAI